MERVTVRMARSDRRTPWGFGVTEASDGSVLIVNIVGGSLADRAGLRNGDVIDKLEDLDNLDINAVDRLLVTAHEKIELVVTRNSSTPAATRIWRPEISENIGAGNDERPFHVNLQHNNDSRPPQGFNNSALPFETDSRVKHIQYNSPLGIYSDKNAAEQYIQQTDGFINNQSARATAQKSDEPAYLRSETLRLLKEQERVGPPTTLSNHPNPQGLPVCFSCSRPILGVMARAAGKDLHADCLSCATCGNSLRNVGHHFIEDKFYCDIHGTQRKAGGRPGMDPNIFVKSSPTAAQPIRQYQPNHQQQQQQQLSPRGASYAPQINRPTSISPEPLGATGKQVTTHYHTPKTQGILSPSQRGIPTAAFGADLQKTANYGSVGAGGTYYDSNRLSPASSQSQTRNHQISQVPSLPSNPPPPTSNHELSSSRVPDSVRCAVSPRRSGKTPRQWPPSATASTNRYWQIDAADQLKKEKPNYGEDLATMIKECEKETEKVEKKGKKENKRLNARRASNITKEQVQQAFEEQKRRTQEINKNQEESSIQIEATKSKIKKSIKAENANQIDKELTVEAPEIKDGRIHWTVIHSPKTSPAHSPAKVSEKAVAQTEEVLKPIAVIGKPITNYRKQLNPIDISKTSIPKPFQIDQINEYHEIRRPVYSSVGIKKPKIDEAQDEAANIQSYIVNKNEINLETITNLKTTVTRYENKSEENDENHLKINEINKIDSSTSPIPTIRLSRKMETVPSVSITDMATSPIKNDENEMKTDLKHLKRVDFSQKSPTIIEEKWKDRADIIDESDILTEASKEDESFSIQHYLKAAPYDGDESELIDNKSDVTSLLDIDDDVDVVDDEEWKNQSKIIRTSRRNEKESEAEKQWRQKAMELLDDDAQTERDLMIVAALNERLQGLREMEDDDRLRAIDCIAKHQSELEQTQSQLSHLLESAILYLRNLKTGEDNKESAISTNEQNAQQQSATLNSGQENNTENEEEEEINELRPPTPPERRVFPFSSNFKNELPNTQGLHDVLDEFNNLLNHPPTPSPPPLPPIRHNYHQKVSDAVEDSRNFLASRLGQYMTIEDDHKKSINQSSTKTLNGFHQAGSSLTKSTFEKTSFDGRPTAGDFKGNSSPLTSSTTTTTKTTTTQQQSGGRVPFCEACKQQIRGAFVLATGKSWCPEHFVCTNSSCGRRLLECGFVEEDGQKFCESCFERHIAPRCAKCSKPIISDCLNALQKKWHPTCFTCAHCQKPFGNSAFYLEQGLPYCEQDWNALFTTKCISCRYPIEAGDRWVEALGNAFHSNCFTCARCNHNLEGESFFAKNGQPFCKLHA